MLQVCKYDFELACHHVVAQDKKAKKLESKIDKLTAGLGLRVEVEAMHETSHTWMPSTQSTRTHTHHTRPCGVTVGKNAAGLLSCCCELGCCGRVRRLSCTPVHCSDQTRSTTPVLCVSGVGVAVLQATCVGRRPSRKRATRSSRRSTTRCSPYSPTRTCTHTSRSSKSYNSPSPNRGPLTVGPDPRTLCAVTYRRQHHSGSKRSRTCARLRPCENPRCTHVQTRRMCKCVRACASS